MTASGVATITGDVGVSTGLAIIGFPGPGVVVPPFILHAPNDGPSILAQTAVGLLFTDLTTRGGVATTIAAGLSGQSLGPGVYDFAGGSANLAFGAPLTLTGNGTYIFRVASTLTTIAGSNIALFGAQACNIWWQVGTSATLGGTTFAGNVIGFTGVNTMGPNAALEGRLLTTIPGSVTLAGNNIVNAAFCAFVAPPPGTIGVTKAFSPNVNGPGGISTLTITLTNDNAAGATLLAPLVDSLPSGVVIAANPNTSTTCDNGVVTAPAGGSSVTLGVGSIIPSGGVGACTVRVNVTSAALGTYTNRIPVNALQTSNGNNIVPGTAILTISNIAAVPTLSEWAMIVLVMLLGLCGFFAIRQRRMTD